MNKFKHVALGVWVAKSATVKDRYHTIKRQGCGFMCSCHDFKINKHICKHIQGIKKELNTKPYKKLSKVSI